MSTQNFQNHVRYVPGYHYVTLGAVLAFIGGAIVHLFRATPENFYGAALLVLGGFILFSVAFYARSFALRAHDKAIRAEEKLRYYMLTGKPMDERLRMGQIIALRFASDEELVALAKRAVDEQLSGKDIKQAIHNWRPDYYQV
ncbi:MAG: DUF6526 family protein [Chitinophagaceae bacterium]